MWICTSPSKNQLSSILYSSHRAYCNESNYIFLFCNPTARESQLSDLASRKPLTCFQQRHIPQRLDKAAPWDSPIWTILYAWYLLGCWNVTSLASREQIFIVWGVIALFETGDFAVINWEAKQRQKKTYYSCFHTPQTVSFFWRTEIISCYTYMTGTGTWNTLKFQHGAKDDEECDEHENSESGWHGWKPNKI